MASGEEIIMALNHISTSTYKADRQTAKLALATAKRQGKIVAEDGTISGSVDPTKPYYRARNTLDITELPTVYTSSDNKTADVTNNPNVGGLVYGRPWISAPLGYTWTAPSGWAGYEIFNGSSQRLSIPASSDWAPGTGAFTIEFVVNFQAGGGSFPRVFSLGSYPHASVACSIEGGGTPTIYFWINGSIAANIDTSGSLFTSMPSFVNNWHHVVLQRNTSGYCNIYIDGNMVTSNTTANTTNLNDTTDALAIAVEPQTGGTYANWMKGYLTNFRWTNSAVYPDSSFSVMSSALTALPQTKLLMLMASSGTLNTDSSTSVHSVTATGSPTWHTA